MVASKSENLCIRVLRSKYRVRENWLRKESSKNGSTIWKAIEIEKPLIENGACYLVGDGKSIDVWRVPWIPWLEGFKPKPKDNSISLNPWQ